MTHADPKPPRVGHPPATVTHPMWWLLILLALSHTAIGFWVAYGCGVAWAVWPATVAHVGAALWGYCKPAEEVRRG